jgi:hypothetical protein
MRIGMENVRPLGPSRAGWRQRCQPALQLATDNSATAGVIPTVKVGLPRRSLLALGLLALLLAVGMSNAFLRAHSSARIATRSHSLPPAGLSRLPLTAQAPISRALAAGAPAYRITASRGSFDAVNPRQRLHARFDRSGVLVGAGATQVGLNLRALGYGASLRAVGAVAPHMSSGRVVYARGGLSEWYANGPLGVEQGFTIPRAPTAHAAGPLTLSMALSGDARVTLAPNGQSLTLAHAGGPTLHYDGLAAADASGRALHSWLQVDAGRLLLRVDTHGARYPLRIDPFIQQGEKLTGSGETEEGELGFSVALSSDGNTALVGGYQDNEGHGAAWVFTRSGTTWTQQGSKLTGSGESGAGEFGANVALSSDGNTALIGGVGDNSDHGAAWVFTRSGSTWTQQGSKLTGSGESGEGEFGSSVALASEGNTALIGGSQDNGEIGAAWVFTRSGSTWTQQGSKLTGSGESEAGEFGTSVALSSEGNTALIGGPSDNASVGAAWVFTRSGSTWTQQGSKLTGSGESGEGEFGANVALSSDGNTALIGGSSDNSHVGAAWVFTRSGSTWSQQGSKLTGSGESGSARFGSSVALASEGNTALIGGPRDSSSKGAAWVFTRSGSTWTQQGSKLTGSGESGNGRFGSSVALSSDAYTALIGGPKDNTNQGAAWSFVDHPEVETAPQGNWVGTYGHQGYDLAAWNGTSDLAETPGVSVTLTHGGRYVWMSGTTDKRALESPEEGTREAATFYDPSELTLQLKFNEAYTGQLHLYAVDWDGEARRETITVGGQEALLNENFHEGAWVTFPIKVSAEGTVTITAHCTGGSNAVISGVFLGGSGAPPSAPVERPPEGTWLSHYGHEGYDLAAWNGSSDLANTPNASLTLNHGSRYVWASRTTEKRALEGPEGFLREAAAYYDSSEVILQLKFKEAYTGQLHLYAVDWDSEARRETISVGNQTALLSSNFHEGAWVTFPIKVSAEGTVTITVQHTAGANAVLSGIFLGGAEAPPSSAPRILVPSYFFPAKGEWETMCNDLPKESIVIVNPENGPATKARSEEYAPDVKYCQEQGQIVIGYVFTEWGEPERVKAEGKSEGTQTETQVKKEIEEYFEWLGVSGIFYDQYATTRNSTTEAYYQGLAEQAASYGANVVDVGNPGVQASSNWELKYVSKVITFEGSAGEFTTYKPETWVTNEQPKQIMNLVYAASTITTMEESCSHAAESNAGDVYVTPRTPGENAWLHLPSAEYFSAEIKSC